MRLVNERQRRVTYRRRAQTRGAPSRAGQRRRARGASARRPREGRARAPQIHLLDGRRIANHRRRRRWRRRRGRRRRRRRRAAASRCRRAEKCAGSSVPARASRPYAGAASRSLSPTSRGGRRPCNRAAAPPYFSSPSIGQWSAPLRARAQCFRSWWRRPCSGFSSSVVTQPDAADGVWPSARQRERAGRPLTGSSTTPSPSSRPATSATYVFRTAPGVANAVASARTPPASARTREPARPLVQPVHELRVRERVGPLGRRRQRRGDRPPQRGAAPLALVGDVALHRHAGRLHEHRDPIVDVRPLQREVGQRRRVARRQVLARPDHVFDGLARDGGVGHPRPPRRRR